MSRRRDCRFRVLGRKGLGGRRLRCEKIRRRADLHRSCRICFRLQRNVAETHVISPSPPARALHKCGRFRACTPDCLSQNSERPEDGRFTRVVWSHKYVEPIKGEGELAKRLIACKTDRRNSLNFSHIPAPHTLFLIFVPY
jgi:hypothetical protein